MRVKRNLSWALVLIMIVTLFIGCSAKTDNNQKSDQTTEDKTTDIPKNEGSGVVLKLFGFTPGYSTVLPSIVEDYYNETGVTVEIETGGEDYYTVLKTRFTGGEAPDIFDLESSYFSSWSDRCADLSQCEFVNHAFEGSLESANVNDEILGFPYAYEGSGFIYNKDIFNEVGIEVPTTLTELKDACVKLKDAGYQAFGEAWGEWGFLMHIFGTPFAYEGDGKALANKLNSGEMKLSDMKYMDNFFELFDLTLDYGLGTESIGYGYASQVPDFASGKMAMIKQGTWLYGMIKAANPDINIGLMAVPLNDNPEDTKLMTSASRYLSINKDSEHYNEASKFLDWLGENIQKYIVDPLGVMAPYDTVETAKLTDLNADMFTYAEKNMTYSSFGTDFWPAGFNIDVATPLQAYAADSMSKEDAISELQTLYNNRIKTSE